MRKGQVLEPQAAHIDELDQAGILVSLSARERYTRALVSQEAEVDGILDLDSV